ncbi:MAG: DegT/DnrJ/EryC1/StrS family aminotransferase [Acidimicrobiales bacterium]|nr:DegT/DnrJ/EryC1/StrS family aminotransferase [Acidimicrobiales bacterium]
MRGSNRFGALVGRLRRAGHHPKRRIIATVDSAMWIIGLSLGSALRYEFDLSAVDGRGLAAMAVLAVVLGLGLGHLGGQYAGRWRVGSIDEAVGLAVLAVQVGGGLLIGTVVAGRPMPIGAVLIGTGFALIGMCATRVAWRLLSESVDVTDSTRRMLVFGAGEAAAQAIMAMLTDSSGTFRPVALLDDDPRKARRSIRGIKVEGTRESLGVVAERHRAEVLLLAIPGADSATLQELSELGAAVGLEVLVLPPAAELYGTLGVEDMRVVTDEDLLGRTPIHTDLHLISGYLSGKTVLVTGAGGSIGSELCKQIHALRPANLVMLDRDESALHAVQLTLTGRAMLDDEKLVVADIRDRDRVFEVLKRWRPEVVFHAAALKHLPLLEQWPGEGVKTNVEGTLVLLEASASVGVERFVNISTDKAADPTSVLGYTKRIAERLTSYYGQAHPGTYLSVRFGNVLGSRGSVLTSFRRQADEGGPLTVTHEDVTRYFMIVEEAVQLVIQAGAIGSDGEALVFDMGVPVRIQDVAERMIKDTDPSLDIVYTGLRPGEKLHEVLLGTDEPDARPAHPLISHAPVPPLDPLEVELWLDGNRENRDAMVRLCGPGARRWSEGMWTAQPEPDVYLDLDTGVVSTQIRMAEPELGPAELEAVREVFESKLLTDGPRTAELERVFAERHDVDHAVAMANGTLARQAVLASLDIGPGDEVIVPSLSFIASAAAICHVGATPVWADVDPDAMTIDPAHVRRQITSRTRAVIAVHFGGQPADMRELIELCDEHDVLLIEDAGGAFGASVNGRPVGGLAHAGVFGFTSSALVATGEGGIVTTNDPGLAQRLRLLRNHGQSARYQYDSIGHNWRMTEMQAAIGSVQLATFDERLARIRERAAWMTERLAGVEGVRPPVSPPGREHSFMLYTLRVARGRERFLSCLHNRGIEAEVSFPPAHRQAPFRGSGAIEQLPVTDRISSEILTIPMHAQLTDTELRLIADTIEATAEGIGLVKSRV